MTRYYIAHPDASIPCVYLIDGDWLAHTVPDWEAIESSESRVWTTASAREAREVAQRFRAWEARVVPYRPQRRA
jgi:hypothetical protein